MKNIKKMMALPEEKREKLAANARIYVEKHFNKEQLLNRLDEIFGENKRSSDHGAHI